MNSNFREYKGYVIKKITIHTVNGACLASYEVYANKYKDRLWIGNKLKDAKAWIDNNGNKLDEF